MNPDFIKDALKWTNENCPLIWNTISAVIDSKEPVTIARFVSSP